jgi:hypothetical protein
MKFNCQVHRKQRTPHTELYLGFLVLSSFRWIQTAPMWLNPKSLTRHFENKACRSLSFKCIIVGTGAVRTINQFLCYFVIHICARFLFVLVQNTLILSYMTSIICTVRMFVIVGICYIIFHTKCVSISKIYLPKSFYMLSSSNKSLNAHFM